MATENFDDFIGLDVDLDKAPKLDIPYTPTVISGISKSDIALLKEAAIFHMESVIEDETYFLNRVAAFVLNDLVASLDGRMALTEEQISHIDIKHKTTKNLYKSISKSRKK